MTIMLCATVTYGGYEVVERRQMATEGIIDGGRPQPTESFAANLRVGVVNRPGFAGGSNSQVLWSHHEQDDEQIQPRGSRTGGTDAVGAGAGIFFALGRGEVDSREDWLLGSHADGVGEAGGC